jgi:hypothetical protein
MVPLDADKLTVGPDANNPVPGLIVGGDVACARNGTATIAIKQNASASFMYSKTLASQHRSIFLFLALIMSNNLRTQAAFSGSRKIYLQFKISKNFL